MHLQRKKWHNIYNQLSVNIFFYTCYLLILGIYDTLIFLELLFTCRDVVMTKYNLLCHTAAHVDIHLCQKLRASLTPAIILWEHGHLTKRYKDKRTVRYQHLNLSNCITIRFYRSRLTYMSQTGASGHDSSLVDGHGIFGVVCYNCVSRFVERCDHLVLLVYFCTSPLRTLKKRETRRTNAKMFLL